MNASKTVWTNDAELARVFALLEDDGYENLNAHDREIVDAENNGNLAVVDDMHEASSEMNYAGGGYNRDSRGNYRENFYAGCP